MNTRHYDKRRPETQCITKVILRLLMLVSTFEIVHITDSFAETGDELVIIGDLVNVRTAPSINSEITAKLPRGEKLIEIQHQGEWIEIDTGRKDIRTGWVHETLISKTPRTPIRAEHVAALSGNPFNDFMETFKDQKENITNQLGDLYFINARFKSEAALEVIATDAWLYAETEERQNALSKVLDIWSVVNPDADSSLVRVYDVQGEQHMMMLR